MNGAGDVTAAAASWGSAAGTWLFGATWPAALSVLIILGKILAIVVPVLLLVAYLTYWERKLIGWMHIRLGPNRVGPLGLLQPIADAVKLIFKEVIVPTQADAALYLAAPVLVMMPALAAWAVIPSICRRAAGLPTTA